MCPDCSEEWQRALLPSVHNAPRSIHIIHIGNPKGEELLEKERKRADEHWQRVRNYQDYIQRRCAEEHSKED